MLKPLVIGSNSLCDFQENLFGITVFLPVLLVCNRFQLNNIYIWPLKYHPVFSYSCENNLAYLLKDGILDDQ